MRYLNSKNNFNWVLVDLWLKNLYTDYHKESQDFTDKFEYNFISKTPFYSSNRIMGVCEIICVFTVYCGSDRSD